MCARHVSEITFTRYPQSQQIGKTNNLKVFRSKMAKERKQDS